MFIRLFCNASIGWQTKFQDVQRFSFLKFPFLTVISGRIGNFIEFLAILGPPRDPEGHFKVGKLTEMVSGQHPGTILGNRTPLRSLTFQQKSCKHGISFILATAEPHGAPKTEIFFKKMLIPQLWKQAFQVIRSHLGPPFERLFFESVERIPYFEPTPRGPRVLIHRDPRIESLNMLYRTSLQVLAQYFGFEASNLIVPPLSSDMVTPSAPQW